MWNVDVSMKRNKKKKTKYKKLNKYKFRAFSAENGGRVMRLTLNEEKKKKKRNQTKNK